MAAPKGNRNALSMDKRTQIGVRLNKTEKQVLQQLYGGVTLGIQTLISSEVERRSDIHRQVRQVFLSAPSNGSNFRTGNHLAASPIQPYYADERVTLYCGDAQEIVAQLAPKSIDCCFTSPPYYGQRDYEVDVQIGLESHPAEYLANLLGVFLELHSALKPTGSLWVNLGDTYWSGKGRSGGTDRKQKNRRFRRPQDLTGKRPWCAPKQLLLIPHRFAILLQEYGWIIRNDNVWNKPDPVPDPVSDRCARVHEYVFHCVKQRKYYFDEDAVAIPTTSGGSTRNTKPYPTVWNFPVNGSAAGKQHIAVFPKDLPAMPIKATCPEGGVFLDPFCGSGTSLLVARDVGRAGRVIGIDADEYALKEAKKLLAQSTIQKSNHP